MGWNQSKAWILVTTVAATGCAHMVDPKDQSTARIHYDIAVKTFSDGDSRAALRELLGTVDLDPYFPEAHNLLGLVYDTLKQSDEALDHYNRAIELNPKFSEAYNNRGILLTELGRYDDAIASFEKALSDILYATPFLAEGNMGWAYYQRGDTAQAIKLLRNAVATSPRFCRGYMWLARIGLDTHDAGMAIDSSNRFDKFCVQDAETLRQIAPEYRQQMQYYEGLGYLQLGQQERAQEFFTRCANAEPATAVTAKCAESLQASK
jgi:type IV pilus assembly protein PilF